MRDDWHAERQHKGPLSAVRVPVLLNSRLQIEIWSHTAEFYHFASAGVSHVETLKAAARLYLMSLSDVTVVSVKPFDHLGR